MQSLPILHFAVCLTPAGTKRYEPGPTCFTVSPSSWKSKVPEMPTTFCSELCVCQPNSVPAVTFFNAPYAPLLGSPQSGATDSPFMAGLGVHLTSPACQTTALQPPSAAAIAAPTRRPARTRGETRMSAFTEASLS